MDTKLYQIEAPTRFSESLIWKLNRDYYNKKGLDAWRQGAVPHYLSSNSKVGKAYAELIFAFLKDLSAKGHTQEKVHIIELGAGHGRLGFHILKHLEDLLKQPGLDLPPYCYILSDIVEENLSFFESHPQFQSYFERGILDVAYFDAVESEKLHLRKSGIEILPGALGQTLIAIGNYFFDSFAVDLFHIKDEKISSCKISLETQISPEGLDEENLLKRLKTHYHLTPLDAPFYTESYLNDLLETYRSLLQDTYLFFPHTGIECINRLKRLSQNGLMLLSMDKGFHDIEDIKKATVPQMITHGSMSFWVNYHAYSSYCEKMGGKTYFSGYSNFSLEIGCLLFLPEADSYAETKSAYEHVVNDYGPDDFNILKKFIYKHVAGMSLKELIGILRLGAYDSTMFVDILPRLRQLCREITFNERKRLAQTLHRTWETYFTINEPKDIAFEMAGIFYDLGFYQDAVDYYQHSIKLFGHSTDSFYNRALCHYQLRQDTLFVETVAAGKKTFPNFEKFQHLDKLDLNAK